MTLFDGTATAADRLPYRDTCTLYIRMKEGKVTKAIALFDQEFDEFQRRLTPKKKA